SQPPVKPVWPVTRTRRPESACSNRSGEAWSSVIREGLGRGAGPPVTGGPDRRAGAIACGARAVALEIYRPARPDSTLPGSLGERRLGGRTAFSSPQWDAKSAACALGH